MNNSTGIGTGQISLETKIVDGYTIVVGVLGMIGNFCVAAGIIHSRQLRSRFYVAICFLCLTRMTICFQYVVSTGYYIQCMFRPALINQTRIVCQLLHTFLYISQPAEPILLMYLAVDCTIAVAKPLYYRLLTVRQAIVTCLAIEALVISIKWFPLFFTEDLTDTIKCTNVFSPVPVSLQYDVGTVNTVIMFLCAFLYLVMISITLWRIRQMKLAASRGQTNNEQTISLKRQMELLPLLRNMIGSHIILTLLSKLFLTLGQNFLLYSRQLISTSVTIQLIDLLVGVIVMLCSKGELRKACMRIPLLKSVTVSAVTNAMSNKQSVVRR